MNPDTHENSVCEENNYVLLHKKYGKQLRNFIYYKCGNLEQAEDIVQDSYIKLWENCANIILEKAKSFLYTIANRFMINSIRRETVRLKFLKSNPLSQNIEDPSFMLMENEFKTRLEEAISELSEKQREVFLMNRVDKMSYEEISNCLGISIKAVEKRMHYALAALKTKVMELNLHKI